MAVGVANSVLPSSSQGLFAGLGRLIQKNNERTEGKVEGDRSFASIIQTVVKHMFTIIVRHESPGPTGRGRGRGFTRDSCGWLVRGISIC